jgi:galactokinase
MYRDLRERFGRHFGVEPVAAAYAPGRVEVIGNHTDYNEGFVLSAAVDCGTFFVAAPSADSTCRLVPANGMEKVQFDARSPAPVASGTWANYVIGVFAGLAQHAECSTGFNGMCLGNVPLGAGLSSSAALEMSAALALGSLYNMELDRMSLARIGQAAESGFAGVRCGLLDQVSSLYGKKNALVRTDFRTLDVQNVPLGEDACFLMCNTGVHHALVDGAYNERRQRCEDAVTFFREKLDHPVAALRDVTWAEWREWSKHMDPITARRAAHPIGENERVLKAEEFLARGDLAELGRLMFESHASSVEFFENSCPEMDTVVNIAKEIPTALGARLSGGGFGGSAIVLVQPRDAEDVSNRTRKRYEREQGSALDVRVIMPSNGARVL